MSPAGRSATQWAARERARARRGVRRRVLAWMGLNPAARRADALAARTAHGTEGEQRTAVLLERLPAGWYVLHDRRLPGSNANLDHVLIAPSGAGIVVVDSKKWHAQRTTAIVNGRVHCGLEDRHDQVEKVAGYAARVAGLLGAPVDMVLPLLVVHCSPIAAPGYLEARVDGWAGTVLVLGPNWLVPTLATATGDRDPLRAAALARHVARVLPEYRW